MTRKNVRQLKVCEKSGYNYKPVPQIQLKGEWLRELGFEIGDYVCISCEDGRLVITRDEERAALVKAEKEFMERETKALQVKFEKEKQKLRAQFVAEREGQFWEQEVMK